MTVRQMRLVVTAPDYDDALAFYRDGLGLREVAAFAAGGGRVTILDAGRATLELTDPPHAAHIDAVEVGRRVAGHIRVAFEIDDAVEATARLVDAGAELVAPPTETPWRSLNSRLEGPAGLQLTLFEELERPAGAVIDFDDLAHSKGAHRIVGAELGDIPFSVILVHTEPGSGPELHRHPYPEVFIVESGRATFQLGAESIVVEAGHVVVGPPNVPHGFTNTGTSELRLTAIHGAGRFETAWLPASKAG